LSEFINIYVRSFFSERDSAGGLFDSMGLYFITLAVDKKKSFIDINTTSLDKS